MRLTMRDITYGQRAVITGSTLKDDIRKRLLSLGFTNGSDICCLFASPFGDPRAYMVRGAVVAVRNADAKNILVERREGEAV